MAKTELILSIDIEADGDSPLISSMLSFSIAAFTIDKVLVDVFSRNLLEREGSVPSPKTMAWWNSSETNRAAYTTTRIDAVTPVVAMTDMRNWTEILKEKYRLTPAAYPAGYDYMWVQAYATAFTRNENGDSDNPLGIACFDLKSFVHGFHKPQAEYRTIAKRMFPKNWFDDLVHTHIAEDDAIEQGCLIVNVLRAARGLPAIIGYTDSRV